MNPTQTLARPAWLTDADERPHTAGVAKNWSENYLTYVWSPATEIGIYFHLCRLPGDLALWDEIMFVALPGDRWLVAKSISPQRDVNGVAVNAVEWICKVPFQSWIMRFRGAAQIVTTEQLAAGPVPDGYHIPVDLALTCEGISVAYDFGAAEMDQSWGTGHYEQNMRLTGSLRYGDETVEIDGTGLRDHSWGPRDYSQIGSTTWIHGQFPDSGRSFMAVRVSGLPPKPELNYAITCDRDGVAAATTDPLPVVTTVAGTETDLAFELTTADGTVTQITAEILRATRCSFQGPAQLILGTDPGPLTNHDYVDAFVRLRWDGERGYGVLERTVDRYPGAESPSTP
jgi:hypothetical protein